MGGIVTKESLLLDACKRRDKDTACHLILDPSIDLNYADKQGRTALMIACEEARMEPTMEHVARMLVDIKSVDVNKADEGGNTALFYACSNKLVEIAYKIIGRPELNINHANRAGNTALMISKDMTTSINMLKRREINIYQENLNGDTAIMVNLVNLPIEILDSDGWEVNKVNKNGDTALTNICKMRFAKISEYVRKMLMNPNIDVNIANKDGETALSLACRSRKFDEVSMLLNKAGIEINTKNSIGETPLMILCESSISYYGSQVILLITRILSFATVDVVQVDQNGNTALINLCEQQYKKEIETLMHKILDKSVVNVNQINYEGNTALILACKNEYNDVAKRILAIRDINFMQVNKERFTAFKYVQEHHGRDIERDEIIKMFVELHRR